MNSPELWAKSPNGAGDASSTAAVDADYYRRLLDRLFSMLSHDLRTPLSAISGWLFLLDSDRLDAAGRKRALEKIRTNLDEEVRLIDDALALARAKAGTLKLEREEIAIHPVLAAVIDATQKAAAAKHVSVELAADAGRGMTIAGDAPRLQRALELIVERAIRDSHGPASKISIETAGNATSIDVIVRDAGRSIDADALRWILDPFGSPPDPATGSRHGPDRHLLIAAALIEANSGRMSVQSAAETAGAIITVTLPRAA